MTTRRPLTRRPLRLLVVLALSALGLVVSGSSVWAGLVSRGKVVAADAVPAGAPRTLIVLGAKSEGGQAGVYLRNRLDVAVDLYRAGRLDRIVDSGNDADDAGNEVQTMRAYLTQRGIPGDIIVDDPIGLNTAATCRRARNEFGITAALIVTQDFHVGRAVGLCEARGIETLGVVAPCDGCSTLSLLRNHLREGLLSRPRAVLNAFL
ncbi:MAG: ElyC/SanA/YdcF family protein [Gordonia sp. (in: high G+C Gram-positive bacteria)]|uniref:SanA/YdcF family protein n=1 Tax=Gordonia sp. (in: high G+C Gram-positive bacteria) TaxID=84139 RepID=UPI0039E658E3